MLFIGRKVCSKIIVNSLQNVTKIAQQLFLKWMEIVLFWCQQQALLRGKTKPN